MLTSFRRRSGTVPSSRGSKSHIFPATLSPRMASRGKDRGLYKPRCDRFVIFLVHYNSSQLLKSISIQYIPVSLLWLEITTMRQTLLSFAWVSAVAGLNSNHSCSKLPIVDLGYQTHQAISFNVTKATNCPIGEVKKSANSLFIQEVFKTFNFSNIPYAEPPVGSLRFRPPVAPMRRQNGVQNGQEGKVCHQANPFWLGIGLQFLQSYATGNLPFNYSRVESQLQDLPPPVADGRSTEDCLVLDVLVSEATMNQKHPRRRAPVLVWIFVSTCMPLNSGFSQLWLLHQVTKYQQRK